MDWKLTALLEGKAGKNIYLRGLRQRLTVKDKTCPNIAWVYEDHKNDPEKDL